MNTKYLAQSVEDDRIILPGMVLLRRGDVVNHYGSGDMLVIRVNECNAKVVELTRELRTVNPRFGNTKTFQAPRKSYGIAYAVDRESVVRHMSEAEIINLLGAKPVASAGEQTTGDETEGSDTVMAKKEGKKRARGGLATAAMETKEKHEGLTTKGSLGDLMGFSTTSVLRRLGKEGVKVAHARAIMKAQKHTVADATVQIQVNNGKNGKGIPAPLTGEQVKELIGSAPEPVEEPKPEKKKGGKKAKTEKAEAAS